MSLNLNARLDEQVNLIQAASNGVLTTTVGDCVYASLKGYRKACVIIDILNATTVTGAVITLKQATAVAGTNEKALAFTRMLSSIDVPTVALAEVAVTSNTFTTDTTNSKRLRYVLDIDSSSLDVAGGFDCFRLDATAAAASLGTVTYILYGARYSGIDPTVD